MTAPFRLASAERLASHAPRTDEERERAFAAAYHRMGVVSIDLAWVLPWPFREMIERWAEARWGKRKC